MKCPNCAHEIKERQDLREYSDNELSLLVFNDEGLYNMRHNNDLWDILAELFLFTRQQRYVLEQDLIEDKEDNNEDN
jgi:hypothetical protein